MGVSCIDCFGATLVERSITTEEMNTEEPIKALMLRRMFSELISPVPDLAAAIAEKTSGAPFPNAKSVTPASDSERPNLVVNASKDGDKYESAVEAKIYISTYIIKPPTGMITIVLADENQVSNVQ